MPEECPGCGDLVVLERAVCTTCYVRLMAAISAIIIDAGKPSQA